VVEVEGTAQEVVEAVWEGLVPRTLAKLRPKASRRKSRQRKQSRKPVTMLARRTTITRTTLNCARREPLGSRHKADIELVYKDHIAPSPHASEDKDGDEIQSYE
jgi:hypothetical protein